MVELIKLFLKLILHVDTGLRDNARLVGSIFIGGAWLVLVAVLFPKHWENGEAGSTGEAMALLVWLFSWWRAERSGADSP